MSVNWSHWISFLISISPDEVFTYHVRWGPNGNVEERQSYVWKIDAARKVSFLR